MHYNGEQGAAPHGAATLFSKFIDGETTKMKTWLTKGIGIGGCMDAVESGGYLFVISNMDQYKEGRGGCLRVLSLEKPDGPRPVAVVPGLGNARQLIVRDDFAYVSAREDGIWIINVKDSENPFVAAHYDPIELATGLALDGRWLYTACRQYGVEVIDVSDPAHPMHAATLRTGEAQSLDVQDGVIYAGVWGSMEVVIIDARDLDNPKQLYRIQLDGKGDGVFVEGNLLYAATGHHRRSSTCPRPEDPEYGSGSGLEIYDISDLSRPVLLSRTHLSERFYYPVYDMWSVTVQNGYAYMTFSFHGAVVMDVHDVYHPTVAAQYVNWIERGDSAYFDMMDPKRIEHFRPMFTFDPAQGLISPATNLALGDGYIYISTGFSDLYAVPFDKACSQMRKESGFQPPKPAESAKESALYDPHEQVHAVCVNGETVLAACGNGGVHELKLNADGSFSLLRKVRTKGIAFDIRLCRNYVFVAEGQEGISVLDRDTLGEKARFADPQGRVVQQLMPSADERFLMIHAGYGLFRFVDIEDPLHPHEVFSDGNENLGGIYGRQICTGIYKEKYMAGHWNSRYIQWYDVSGDVPCAAPMRQPSIGFRGSMAICHEQALVVYRGGYYLYDPEKEQEFPEGECIRVPGTEITGKPVVIGGLLFISDRMLGGMQVLDVTDALHPVLLYEDSTKGNADLVVRCSNRILWPLGYAGLKSYPIGGFSVNGK